MTTTYSQFFQATINGLKIHPLNGGALRALAVVSILEGANNYWNPLNIVWPPGSGGDFNSAHVQKYGSAKEGIAATVKFLNQPRWKWVKYALAHSDRRYLILRQFEVEYDSWGSHPDFYGITYARAQLRLQTAMKGPK